ncbi:hypothetical protein BJ875DRAFT_528212 [Amylocarpus encephaloides]|uniref:Sulfotransferase domain-containing protein n=1 Tax=Amylocarpus encephaloides TaxID=45428 RepID=A0A9P7YLF8_9HELO|nr:hypothetical protein BJ875DRAFT_528212 [Amylocarpus encephaloides]
METKTPQRYFLLTYPRTASNLLIKILNLDEQPSVQSSERGGYFLMPQLKAFIELFGSNSSRHLRPWTLGEKAKVKESQQGCYETMKKHAEDAAKEGKGVFVKEHVPWLIRPSVEREFLFGSEGMGGFSWGVDAFPKQMTSKLNETIFPDEFLKMWKPTFLIRHPALAFPSDYRTSVDLNGAEFARDRKGWELDMTLKWSRTLYDWYLLNTSSTDSNFPIILDADDIMRHPELMVKYSKLIGLDAEKLRFKWDAVSSEQQEGMWAPERRMRDSIDNSEGVIRGKSSIGIDLGEEGKRWKVEFGEMGGERLEGWVRGAMGDYEYLRGRRLRL